MRYTLGRAGRVRGRWTLGVVWACLLLPAAAPALTTIGDFVWLDADGDGVQDAGEVGFPNVTVRLYDATSGALLQSTITNGSGNYWLGLDAGTYFIEFVAPAGFTFAASGQGGDAAKDSDADGDGRTTTFTVDGTTGDDTSEVDCGLIEPTLVGDLVFEDADGDGLQDSGEGGVPNVTLQLWDPGGDGVVGGGDDLLVKTTSADGAGAYEFGNLVPGSYYAKITLPSGFGLSPADQGADDQADSDFDSSALTTAVFTLSYGEQITSIDAGLFELVTVRGQVFDDADADGVRQSGEGALSAAATVELYEVGADGAIGGSDDTLQDSVSTTSAYSFSEVSPGTYYVAFTAPAGLDFVDKDQGGDDASDSDVDPDTGRSAPFSLTSGASDVVLDAGLHPFAAISGIAFRDSDEDGIRDGGEGGLQNAIAALNGPGVDGQAGTADDQIVTVAISAADGSYRLSRIVAGSYYVLFTPPAGFSLSPQDQGGDDSRDSDADPNTGRTALFSVSAGSQRANLDVGLLADADSDGVPDSQDGCPNDAAKTEPGECGCGTLDADSDGDGVIDCVDNCPETPNADQNDFDQDGAGDECDNCPAVANADQADADADGLGDACDAEPQMPAAQQEPAPTGSQGEPTAETGPGAQPAAPGQPPACGACGALGPFSYGLSLAGYVALRACRRRRH